MRARALDELTRLSRTELFELVARLSVSCLYLLVRSLNSRGDSNPEDLPDLWNCSSNSSWANVPT